MKTESAIGMERRKPAVARIETDAQVGAYKDELFQAISERAYAVFKQRDGGPGHALSDWLAAESELLRPMPCELARKGNELMLRAEVPGFNERELRIGTASREIWIMGCKQRIAKGMPCKESAEDVIFNELKSKDAFRIIELPVEIDPESASVTLHRGILTIFVRKRDAGNPIAAGQ